jgi:hypothetical protein
MDSGDLSVEEFCAAIDAGKIESTDAGCRHMAGTIAGIGFGGEFKERDFRTNQRESLDRAFLATMKYFSRINNCIPKSEYWRFKAG